MARVGAGTASEQLPDGAPSATAFAVADGCAMNASALGGGLNAEGCHSDRKLGSRHCHRGSGSSARIAAAPLNTFTQVWIKPAPVRITESGRLRELQGSPLPSPCDAANLAMARIRIVKEWVAGRR